MQLINDSGGNSSYLWKHINALLNRKPKCHGEIKELNIKGTISTNIKDIANELNTYFIQSVDELTSNFEKTLNIDELNLDPQQLQNLNNITNGQASYFNIEQTDHTKIQKIIMQLNNSKAKDTFGINALFLKKHSAILISPLLHLINLSIKEGKFPQSFKMAIITPIYKSGALTDASNYRPISILPAMSKVLEKVIANQLMSHLENN